MMQRAPRAIGALAVEHYKENFVKGGFVNNGLNPWPKRKGDKDPGRATLVKRARLKNGNRIFRANQKEVVIGNSVPYAKIHNEGGTITQSARSELFVRNRRKKGAGKGRFKRGTQAGRGFSYGDRKIRIPKRQFMGDSKELRTKITNWYITNLRREGII